MKVFESLGENFKAALAQMPFFKRQQRYSDNGDVISEDVVQMTEEEKSATFPVSADSFADGMDKLPNVDMFDKFDAIDRLSAAIAGIQYSKSNKEEKNEEK